MLGRDSLRYVSVRNIGVKTLRIHDRDLPGGYIDIEPGQEYPMPIGTYRRNIRRMGLVGLQRTDLIPQDPEPIPQEELAEAKKMAAALKSGASLPGGCTSKRQCESYCSDAAHMRECITFGESAGLIPPEELAEARKVADYLESGGTMPGGCRGKGECESYCEKEANAEECMNFALKAGFVSDKEAEIIKKTGYNAQPSQYS